MPRDPGHLPRERRGDWPDAAAEGVGTGSRLLPLATSGQRVMVNAATATRTASEVTETRRMTHRMIADGREERAESTLC